MKIFTGKVIGTKMQKTATVEVVRTMAHPMYGKLVKKTRKYQVHDELGTKVGDIVRFVACRPISKLKKWKVLEVVQDKKEKVKSSKGRSASGRKGAK
jgi:small subunit ribosomal protein S17